MGRISASFVRAESIFHWIRQEKFVTYTHKCRSYWRLRIHPDWLAPFKTANREDLLSGPQMRYWTKMNLSKKTDYAMLAEMQPHQNTWKEVHRWIVVADNWEQNSEKSQA